MSGLLSTKHSKNTRSDYQFLFVNDRLIIDRSLHSVVVRAMEKIWGGQSGAYCLFLKIPEASVDVNIHPNKTVVKFEESALVYALLKGAIETQAKEAREFHLEKKPVNDNVPQRLDFSYKNIWQGNFEIMQVDPAQYLVKTQQNEFYFLDLQALISHLLQVPVTDENQLMPLLIALSFKVPNYDAEKIKKKLEKQHFLFDILNEDEVILTALPTWLSYFDYESLVTDLIADRRIDFNKMQTPISSLENFIEAYGLTKLREEQFLKPVAFDFYSGQVTCRP